MLSLKPAHAALLLATLFALPAIAQDRAKNVILFFGDGVGITSLHAARIHGHKEPQKLYLQSMPYLAFADTTSLSHWVTDAGAGSTAMATGRKTANRMLSAYPPGANGTFTAKTLLDYAEERGLSTGLISDANIANPLVSAFYARQDNRSQIDEVFMQILSPRFGDGVDIAIGPGKAPISSGTASAEPAEKFSAKGYVLSASIAGLSKSASLRNVVLLESSEFDLNAALDKTIEKLSRNPKGYFLVVHVDCHRPRVSTRWLGAFRCGEGR